MQMTLGAAGSIALGRLFLEVLPAALVGQTPNAFSTRLLLKDARTALSLAETVGAELPVTRTVVEELDRLASMGAQEDFTALFARLAAG
jgi:3-hydroxyisobutyrate dehydrogenase-like beta-hydroxyacid dehydrogenase